MTSKKELEIYLQQCEGFKNPKVMLEQYVTPSNITADLLNLAFLKGDIRDKRVFDLGCGTGRLAIGAALLGSKHVVGFDIDSEALEIARANAKRLKADVTWELREISDLNAHCDTVVQNPPFGVKKKGADRPFIKAGLKAGNTVYTMHKAGTEEFIKKYIDKIGGRITDIGTVVFPLPYSYSFHKKRVKKIDVNLYRIERRDQIDR